MPQKIMNCYRLPTELTFMLSLAVRDISPPVIDDFDSEKFGALVSKNRLEPLIADGIKKLPADDLLKNEVFREISERQDRYFAMCTRRIQALAQTIKVLSESDIRALSLKGPILAVNLYQNPALRYSRDLDILVDEADFDKACKCLEDIGYTEDITVFNKTPLRRKKSEKNGEEMHRVYMMGDICVELHWRLSYLMNADFEKLWKNSGTRVLVGQEIHFPGEYDNLSYLTVHAAGHGYSRLRWLIDIYELLKKNGFPFDTLYRYTAEQNVGMLTLETILVLYLIPVFDLPQYESDVFRIKRENDTVTFACDESIKEDFARAVELAEAVYPIIVNDREENGIAGRRYDFMLPTVGRKRTIRRFVAELFEPCKADYELIDLPDSLYFLYYIIRPFHKMWRCVADLFGKQ